MTTDRLTITAHTHGGGPRHEGPLSECREHSHRHAESRNIVVRSWVATCTVEGCAWYRAVEPGGLMRCEIGVQPHGRCMLVLGHEGPHSN